jgi:ankyrin repeat protein
MVAISNGHEEIALKLKSKNCNFDLADKFGQNALSICCVTGLSKIARVLIDNGRGIDVDEARNDSLTPLMLACIYNHQKIVLLLSY